jgi:hypothetical protein
MGGLDMSLDNVGGLGNLGSLTRNDDDERARRLQNVIEILSVSYLPPGSAARIC